MKQYCMEIHFFQINADYLQLVKFSQEAIFKKKIIVVNIILNMSMLTMTLRINVIRHFYRSLLGVITKNIRFCVLLQHFFEVFLYRQHRRSTFLAMSTKRTTPITS